MKSYSIKFAASEATPYGGFYVFPACINRGWLKAQIYLKGTPDLTGNVALEVTGCERPYSVQVAGDGEASDFRAVAIAGGFAVDYIGFQLNVTGTIDGPGEIQAEVFLETDNEHQLTGEISGDHSGERMVSFKDA